MKVVFPSLRILFGLTFIASGILKLFPIDYFELILVDQVGLSWKTVPVFARFVIWAEIVIGLCIVFSFRLKLSLIASLSMLSVFTIYLIAQVLSGNGAEDCGCFGELIPLDGPSSIIKNLIFILIGSVLLIMKSAAVKWRWSIAAPILSLITIPIILGFFPLPEYNSDADFELDIELLERSEFPDALHSITNGRKVVVVMLAKCIHCAQLASLIAQLEPEEVKNDLRIIVMGKDEAIDFFIHETNIEDFQISRSSDRELLGAIGGTFPTVIFADKGEVKSKWKGQDVNIKLLNELLQLD
jgi:uncharacterized membrane protein YphA (DoxX/SURF4 family)/thiol-disulfide isomerase/thioredoxin